MNQSKIRNSCQFHMTESRVDLTVEIQIDVVISYDGIHSLTRRTMFEIILKLIKKQIMAAQC